MIAHDWYAAPGPTLRCRACSHIWSPDETLAQQGSCFRNKASNNDTPRPVDGAPETDVSGRQLHPNEGDQ